MPEDLREMLNGLADLDDAALDDLVQRLTDEFDRLDGDDITPDVAAAMEEIASGIKDVRAEQTTRGEAREDAQRRADEARNAIHGDADGDGSGDADGGDAGDGDGADGDADGGDSGDADGDASGDDGADDGADDGTDDGDADTGTGAGRPAARAASAGRASRRSPGQMSQHRPDRHAPSGRRNDDEESATVTVVSQRNFSRRDVAGGVGSGQEITSWDEVVDAMVAAVDSLGTRRDSEKIAVFSTKHTYPKALQLDGTERDAEKIDTALGRKRGSLVASGGICAPVNVDYSIDVMADDSEPIAAALPVFQATRGGIRFIQPPTMSSVGASATAIWTEATDAQADPNDPNTPRKPVQRFECGQEVEVLVDAIPTRFQFGNMMARFSPEQVEANTKLALANAARAREEYRLSKISAYSTTVSSGVLLGAARDLLATLDQAAAAYRYRHRLARTTVLDAIFPEFLIDLFRVDLLRELAHDRDGENNLALTDAQVTSLLTARGVRPIWTMDDVPVATESGITWAYQGFGAQQGGHALVAFPAQVVWFLFATGTFQRLDGGRMDFGVIRDSVLDSTNDYEVMTEVFEGMAKRGPEALQIVSTLVPFGGSAGTVDTKTALVH